MTEEQKRAVRDMMYKGLTPLEASRFSGVSWHEVALLCEKEGLRPGYFLIARDVRKATLADAYGPCKCHTQ